MDYMMNWGMGFGFGLNWLFIIVFWILIIFAIVALIRGVSGERYERREKEKTALDILKERYAKGEISKAEFEEKKRDLEK